jgi:hypothetical protein
VSKKKQEQTKKVYVDIMTIDDEDYDRLKNKSDSYIRGWNKVKRKLTSGG